MKILALCTVEYGIDSLQSVVDSGFDISYLIGLNPKDHSSESVSGLIDVKDFETTLKCISLYADDYLLKSSNSKELISSLEYDLIWVVGWQRLIPEWFILSSKYGAIGGHGSPDGINLGRGRSPQNWAIMLGAQSFSIALFFITPGVDDGAVLREMEFDYLDSDNIQISYKKVALCIGEMMVGILKSPEMLKQGKEQSKEGFYYPKRTPKDGYVDWNLFNKEVVDFCKSLSRPYPGARTMLEQTEIIIWKVVPFDNREGTPGQVSFCFHDSSFLVFTRDGRVLVEDYTIMNSEEYHLSVGQQFTSVDFKQSLKSIVDRHLVSYPDQPVTDRILKRL